MNIILNNAFSNLVTILVVSTFFLSGCENGGKSQELMSREQKFTDAYSFSLNSEIELAFIETLSQVSPDRKIALRVINTTSNCVKFPANFGIMILVYKDDGWHQIPNLVNYLPDEEITLMPAGDFFSDRLVFVRPDLSNVDTSQNLEIRILVAGFQCDSNSRVGAFTDVAVGN